jgi:hypothetical protein
MAHIPEKCAPFIYFAAPVSPKGGGETNNHEQQ